MSKVKTDRSKERLKLYRKVRNSSSWGSTVFYLLMMILFVVVIVFLAGFVLEYIFETKFAEGYSELLHTAKLYESGNGEKSIMDYITAGSSDFKVTDPDGNVIYQQGSITCADEGGSIDFANGDEHYYVYADTELDLIYPSGSGRLGFKFKDFIKWYDNDKDIHELPIWVSTDIKGGTQKFIGKTYLSFTKRETILAIELLSGLVIVVLVFFIITVNKIIKSAVNYRRIVKLFYSDPVTYGHNWMWFIRYGDERLQSSFSKKDSFVVLDLVFKNYRNYCLCHSIQEGEELLSKIDKLLSRQLKRKEMCAHSTKSSFALLLGYTDDEALKERLNSVIATLKSMDSEHNFDFQIGADIIRPVKNNSGKIVKRKNYRIENFYNNACAARAALGDSEESDIRIFDSKLLEEQRWRDTVQEHQWAALNKEEFVVFYQPKFDPRTNELRGAEALVRWDSPEFGFVTPGRIIPIFEKNGFITEIDHYMISHVARDQKAWLDEGYKCVPVSVNVSRAHFAENDLAVQIRDLVDEAGCPHELIEIELTESAFFDDKKAMIETIRHLKEYGFEVSMDDFGAGYSSLNSLKDMPLDVLKLDADFFRGESEGGRGEIVVSEAIRLAKSLDMRTVAEGVEEKEQVEFLAEQGCDMIQGYYYSKPLPKNEYTEKMSR